MLRTPAVTARWLPPLLALSAAACSKREGREQVTQQAESDADRRIAYYSQRVEAEPRLYPAYVQLASARLDRARRTHEPQDLILAEEALTRSLAIQPTVEAYQVRASLYNLRHRFELALEWADRALESDPRDTSMVAAKVEAFLGLGEIDRAVDLVARQESQIEDFYLASTRGHCLKVQGDREAASAAFRRAADHARKVGSIPHASWATVQAAGVWLDAGEIDRATELLDRAAELDPDHPELLIHRAEVHEARGQLAEALQLYQHLLSQSPNADVTARVARLARRLGQESTAQSHFDAAERIFRRSVEAGEVYDLGALARLYLDADLKLDDALALARRNLQFTRDGLARETLQRVEARLPDGLKP